MITKQLLNELVHYNPETGAFTLLYRDRIHFKSDGRHKHWNDRFAGRLAGYVRCNGYVFITILDKKYRAHRLAWLYMTGEFPSDQIDHINGIRSDNRWSNLRSVTNEINAKNQKRKKNNSSGVTGVWWSKQKRKWVAEIMVNYKKIHIGLFSEIEKATAARKEAEKMYGFHKNHGRC